jgi:methionine-rich copper-binding protein CopC
MCSSGTAWAHAELESSIPEQGAILQALPEVISATFGEKLLLLGEEKVNTIALVDPQGIERELRDIQVVDETMSARLATIDSPSPGDYQIRYRVVSADGHPVAGEISFTYKPGEVVASDSPSPKESTFPDSDSSRGFITPILAVFIFIGFIALILAVLLIRRKK